jgi:GTPase SAR1 family protein
MPFVIFKITLIVGLPGSGKTTLAASMMDSDTVFIDDPSTMNDPFRMALESDKSHVIMCDPMLAVSDRNTVIKVLKNKFGMGVDIQWIYFDNDPVQAWKNHEKRNSKNYRELSKTFFDDISQKYNIPSGQPTIPVYKD